LHGRIAQLEALKRHQKSEINHLLESKTELKEQLSAEESAHADDITNLGTRIKVLEHDARELKLQHDREITALTNDLRESQERQLNNEMTALRDRHEAATLEMESKHRTETEMMKREIEALRNALSRIRQNEAESARDRVRPPQTPSPVGTARNRIHQPATENGAEPSPRKIQFDLSGMSCPPIPDIGVLSIVETRIRYEDEKHDTWVLPRLDAERKKGWGLSSSRRQKRVIVEG
jgi:hypothetical protein